MKRFKALTLIAATCGVMTVSAVTQAEALYEQYFSGVPTGIWNKEQISYNSSSKDISIKYDIYKNDTQKGSYPKLVSYEDISRKTNSATLKYRIKFDKDYSTTQGGKFFGIAPENHVTGCKEVEVNSWSARVGFANRVPQLYLYFQNKPDRCGQVIPSTTGAQLNLDQWYDVALYVELNSEGKYNAKAKLFIDKQLVAKKTGFRFHGLSDLTDEVKIHKFMLSTFLGSISSTSGAEYLEDQSGYIHYDTFKVIDGYAWDLP
ncbi:hypothetical protein IC617_15040 [Neiella sp. HB171785]|uniref:Polysaccharide lyase 14 domain-containing protein n=1 Tax=Neiella litorisoli TaxID=2771431 RepID=A0A8J6R3T3_9GAMM|nr:hypothetical protein [Neiella litorisoli]MBD1390745.1 hypothetical protein [Neiella litorisoli]